MGKKIKDTNKIQDSEEELFDLFTTDKTDQFERDIIKSRRLFLNAKVNKFH